MTSIKLKITPFTVPSEVLIQIPGSGKREDGIQQPFAVDLSQLDEEILAALCEEFTTSVFMLAGKTL